MKHYYDAVNEFLQRIDSKDEAYKGDSFDGTNYCYPLDSVDGIYAADNFIRNIKLASDGKADNMLVLSMNSKTHTADLSAFLHKHLDDATKEKEHDELEK